jgi:hypothetical protein
MNRLVSSGYREAIGYAESLIPARVRGLLGEIHYLCGVSPVYVGLHNQPYFSDGRSASDTAHIAWLWFQDLPKTDRVSTICLPIPKQPWVVIHEIGHLLDERTGFRLWPKPVNRYAETDGYEAFAEAFRAWIMPWSNEDYPFDFDVFHNDRQTLAFFENL